MHKYKSSQTTFQQKFDEINLRYKEKLAEFSESSDEETDDEVEIVNVGDYDIFSKEGRYSD